MYTHPLVIVNRSDRSWTKSRFVLWFGQAGPYLYLMVWANGIDSALDTCVDWLADNTPGLLSDEIVNADYEKALAEGLDEDEAASKAIVDTTCAGNNGHYLMSDHWEIVFENPSRQQLKDWLVTVGVKGPLTIACNV